ncbi:DUF2497 domain-containing protein [Rhizobium sp. RU36D]|uniref:DUF2497 domain-containing protein n=1 Tax=Rhizobium sp. RU36D TaxID=1907415 RepID=UPI0009D839F7|nr:DUF2497 domain-containing protein [Rhizobium sp. RU36D]SMC64455.1 hypothetical protein SAMN05880593_10440 [Rhizobium sp. RU36D]
MAQSSVAREPSMEEILASIRRIIESNDPVGKDAGRSPIYAGDDNIAEDELSVEDARELSLMLEAANDKAPSAAPAAPQMRPEMRMSAPAPEMRPAMPVAETRAAPAMVEPAAGEQARQAPKSISLADLAARVRAAADRGEGMGLRPTIQPQPTQVENPMMTSRMADLRNPPDVAPEQPVARQEMPPRPTAPQPQQPMGYQPASDYQAMGAELQAALDSAARQIAPAVLREPMAKAVVAPAPEVAAPVAELEDQSRSLISATAGEQIARSFDELAAAIDGTQRRSLDEMAEEMLRPMLQEWLDDNLPTLVERLVREEIERVARGPRR